MDVGYKCEGHIPIREFQKRDKKTDVKIGDRIEVFLEKKESEAKASLILSKEQADKVTIWRDISSPKGQEESPGGKESPE